MSRDNVEVVRKMVEAVNEARFEDFLEALHEDHQWHTRADEPDAGVHHGIDKARRYLVNTWVEAFPDTRVEVEEFMDPGDYVITVGRIRATGGASGVRVDDAYVWVQTLRDGKVVETREYATASEALEAVGLRE
jgi:ketosteroid isomerase-like protein